MSESHDTTPAATPSPPAHDPHAAPHGDHSHHDMHLGLYFGVGAFLLVATIITVWLSYVDFDKMFGIHHANIVVALIVATIKVGFVAAIFMHLKGEKAMIWKFLFFTMFFVAGLFLLTLLHYIDPIFSTSHTLH
jgi:caa(3)-type oxidase subunit IV